ncbi:MAG TPA: hypothetical protein VG324_14345 [Blastocatellia bacterium]|nr:hypothetical protein [Blastocatellia bacterium]
MSDRLDSLSPARFVAQCLELDWRGVRFSVGVVGLKQHAEGIEALWITITNE